ncbi:ABC transporter permease [Phytoactinopolyspora halotolerans]|uniref:ABC transporter permease n=1 Tax=Phytoactinopolyspora halotolerans TaxID=1981512 RepID=A0A6L9SBZ2_9ACTN|nr:ABC transporter permease [Phytoactinopolyspora halotolerans]NEE02607.1 ABC transporter permease [Phytoactinopolyspora halotolerans]
MTALSQPTLIRPGAGAGLQVRLAANETAKGLLLAWRRRSMVVVGLVMNAALYLGINFFIGGGHIVEELMLLTLPALMAVVVASIAAVDGSGGIAEEINGGTLEQVQLSPASAQAQVLGRVAALAVPGLVVAAVLGTVFIIGFGLDYQPHPSMAVPVVLTLVDALGYALLIIALTVRIASIGAITHVFNMAIMFFGGMIVPIAMFPDVLENVVRVIPTALGVQVLNTTLAGEPLSTAWSDGTLPWLLVHTVVLTTLGLVLYGVNVRRAQREGGLSPR